MSVLLPSVPWQVLARVSVVRGDRSERMGEVLIDDYIRTSEPVVDYLTKYSGIQPGKLH
jgi:PAB-dependent poly(A)-specific ribonuclease subunit 2